MESRRLQEEEERRRREVTHCCSLQVGSSLQMLLGSIVAGRGGLGGGLGGGPSRGRACCVPQTEHRHRLYVMLAVAELQAAAEMHRQEAGRKCEARDAEELQRKQEDLARGVR